jgi:glutathione S-transferase
VDTLSPVGKLIPDRGRERAEVKTWEALADGLLDAAILARLEASWSGRKDSERSQAWIDRQIKKIDDSLIAMNRALAERSHCVGIHLSLADIAVGVAVSYLDFRFPNIHWRQAHPNLAALSERLALRPSFKDSLPN